MAYWRIGSSRNDGRIKKNDRGRVERITRRALQDHLGDGERLKELWRLHGVSTAVASALLTVWRPRHFAVIDSKVWSLCRRNRWVEGHKSHDGIRSYRRFLAFCRSQRRALNAGWTVRRVEQVLYALAERLA